MKRRQLRDRPVIGTVGTPPQRILLIEDDHELARSLVGFLHSQGYRVEHAADGEAGLLAAQQGGHSAVILDRRLPVRDGVSLVRILRQQALTVPVIFLTTLDGVDDRVQGLEAGADDYLVKPFAFEELLARVRALTRRLQPGAPLLRAGSIELNLSTRTATRQGQPIDLLPQEFRLLEYLVRNADTIVTRRMLLEHVWDIHFDPHTSVVESHISRLRLKLNAGFDSEVIRTVRGLGYKLAASL